jgi:hypothetical protein
MVPHRWLASTLMVAALGASAEIGDRQAEKKIPLQVLWQFKAGG